MYEDRTILCVANSYDKKYYFNDDFESLPESIQEDLKIICVLYTEDVGGTLTIGYEEDGSMYFEVMADDNDLLFDEIGSHLKIKQIQREKKDLWESLETYYKVFFLDEDYEE